MHHARTITINVRCRDCKVVLSGWLPIPHTPDGTMLLYHLSQLHPVELKPSSYLRTVPLSAHAWCE